MGTRAVQKKMTDVSLVIEHRLFPGHPSGFPGASALILLTDLPYWRGRFLDCVFYFTTHVFFCQGFHLEFLDEVLDC